MSQTKPQIWFIIQIHFCMSHIHVNIDEIITIFALISGLWIQKLQTYGPNCARRYLPFTRYSSNLRLICLPHYYRDLARPVKEEPRPKTPPPQAAPHPQPHPQQPHEELREEDLNDLISAFSLDSSKRTRNRSKLVILSPQRRLTKFEATPTSGASPALRIPRRPVQQRQRAFQVQNAYNGLNFSPTTTKFTLLYGHHQPPTFKIVSPAKLGLDASKLGLDSRTEDKIEELMGKKILPNNSVFRSLPDFTTSTKKGHSLNTQTPLPRKPPIPPTVTSMNVNGKGLVGPEAAAEKPKIHVRPDWAAKYLKWYFVRTK